MNIIYYDALNIDRAHIFGKSFKDLKINGTYKTSYKIFYIQYKKYFSIPESYNCLINLFSFLS